MQDIMLKIRGDDATSSTKYLHPCGLEIWCMVRVLTTPPPPIPFPTPEAAQVSDKLLSMNSDTARAGSKRKADSAITYFIESK